MPSSATGWGAAAQRQRTAGQRQRGPRIAHPSSTLWHPARKRSRTAWGAWSGSPWSVRGRRGAAEVEGVTSGQRRVCLHGTWESKAGFSMRELTNTHMCGRTSWALTTAFFLPLFSSFTRCSTACSDTCVTCEPPFTVQMAFTKLICAPAGGGQGQPRDSTRRSPHLLEGALALRNGNLPAIAGVQIHALAVFRLCTARWPVSGRLGKQGQSGRTKYMPT